eukprot:1147406-Pelagomonas_calceolata.AAC.5
MMKPKQTTHLHHADAAQRYGNRNGSGHQVRQVWKRTWKSGQCTWKERRNAACKDADKIKLDMIQICPPLQADASQPSGRVGWERPRPKRCIAKCQQEA